MNMTSLENNLEAVLFISPRPLSIHRLAAIVETEETAVSEALAGLIQEYNTRGGGLVIVEHAGEAQMVTRGEVASVVQKFIKDETTGELTRPSLETLTIIAYRGPITRLDLEKIRGVNCSIILRNLMMRGLVRAEEDEKKLTTYYVVSVDFLRWLGLTRVSELPDYDTLHHPEALERFLEQEAPAQ